jgi:hypothetical protein
MVKKFFTTAGGNYMHTPKKSKKRYVIDQLVGIQDSINDLLMELCPPCPECCPPRGPCEPGEIHDYGKGEIYRCEHCDGRGYLIPYDD